MQLNILLSKFRIIHSIPIYCIGALLLPFFLCNNSCSAATGTSSNSTDSTPTASLSLSNSNITSNAVEPGNAATASTSVTVTVDNAESYSLTLAFNKVTLTNGSTIINAGNATGDNTWGYKWDNAAAYSAPTTAGTNLTVPTLVNNAASFTKTLAFAVKFANNAEPGHYSNTGTLALVATPKKITFGGITKMQDMTANICTNAAVGESATLTDDRTYPSGVDKTYTIYKMQDNRCWMTQNLRITGTTITSSNSNVSSNYTIPASNLSGFSDSSTNDVYYDSTTQTGYYSWCVATAGTCASGNSAGVALSYSVCPRGWRLPTGGSNGEFQKFVTAENITNSAEGSTKIQGYPYNFSIVGFANFGKRYNSTSYWWSSTAASGSHSYALCVSSNTVNPSQRGITGGDVGRYSGFSIRCIADNFVGGVSNWE